MLRCIPFFPFILIFRFYKNTRHRSLPVQTNNTPRLSCLVSALKLRAFPMTNHGRKEQQWFQNLLADNMKNPAASHVA